MKIQSPKPTSIYTTTGPDTKTCPCGKTMRRKDHDHARWMKRTYCSRECMFKYQKKARWM